MTLKPVLRWESGECYSQREVTETKVRTVEMASVTSEAGGLLQIEL